MAAWRKLHHQADGKTRKSLEARLDKLLAADKKDDVITFEQLGVDRLFVDESHAFKNLFLYTKCEMWQVCPPPKPRNLRICL